MLYNITSPLDSSRVIMMVLFSVARGLVNCSNLIINSSSNLSEMGFLTCLTNAKRLKENQKVKVEEIESQSTYKAT